MTHHSPEHMAELNKVAWALRHRRNEIRKDVASGRITVAVALADPAVAKLRVVDVLCWQDRWRERTAERFIDTYEICSPFAYASQLTDRQRMLVARGLRVGKMAA